MRYREFQERTAEVLDQVYDFMEKNPYLHPSEEHVLDKILDDIDPESWYPSENQKNQKSFIADLRSQLETLMNNVDTDA